MSSVEAVTIRDVRYRYGDRVALDGVSLDVSSRSIFGLLGPNGGGKTTLFRLLSTLSPLQEGSVQVLGSNIKDDLFEIRRRIGVVFQSPSLDPKLSVRENLTHHARLYGLTRSDYQRRIAESLAIVGLSDRANERVEKLSGGLARRAELAKGLLHRPEMLILDEPSTGLDPAARYDLWQYLSTLPQQGVTVLTTTHLMEEAEHCQAIAIINKGKLVAVGKPQDLRAEIGGEVVTIESKNAVELTRRLRDNLGIEAETRGNTVRFEQSTGYRSLPSLIELAEPMMESISIARPTLEDVFLKRTGHRFWGEGNDE